MNDSKTSGSSPPTPDTGPGSVGILTVLILLTPFAALAAGACSFVGISIAVAGWGAEFLRMGAAVGAGVGVLLVCAWAVVFIGHARKDTEGFKAHTDKLSAYFQDMKNRGYPDEPSIFFKLLWMLGLKVPPEVFLGTWGSFFFPVGVFGPLVLTAGAFVWWQRPNSPPWTNLTASIFLLLLAFAGGIYNVKATRSLVIKLSLPSWENYLPPPKTEWVSSKASRKIERPAPE